jgi:hypothetical protein
MASFMPGTTSVTFRDQTTGRINDLLSDEGMVCARSQNLLSYLAGSLLSYREEGIEFSPSIVLCGSVDAFLKSFPGGVAHRIGKVPLGPAFAPRILKDCAPLTNRNWYIFIERTSDEEATYGVFTYFMLPTAIPLHEGVTIDATQFCVLIRRISANTVEMRGARGSVLTLVFSTVRDALTVETPVDRFCEACCMDVADERIKKDFKVYFCRVLQQALALSHGTMLVCGRDLDLAAVQEMHDAVPVSPNLDFQRAFAEYYVSETAGSLVALQRCEELLQRLFTLRWNSYLRYRRPSNRVPCDLSASAGRSTSPGCGRRHTTAGL